MLFRQPRFLRAFIVIASKLYFSMTECEEAIHSVFSLANT
jgi:uncharacterized protein YegP (UPF0339 family)